MGGAGTVMRAVGSPAGGASIVHPGGSSLCGSIVHPSGRLSGICRVHPQAVFNDPLSFSARARSDGAFRPVGSAL
jgi:hypothetical protein